MKSFIYKTIFIGSLSLFCLLTGALLGGSVFRSSGGHGMAGLGSMLMIALAGGLIGLFFSIYLLIKIKTNFSKINQITVSALTGSVIIVGIILILDHFDHW